MICWVREPGDNMISLNPSQSFLYSSSAGILDKRNWRLRQYLEESARSLIGFWPGLGGTSASGASGSRTSLRTQCRVRSARQGNWPWNPKSGAFETFSSNSEDVNRSQSLASSSNPQISALVNELGPGIGVVWPAPAAPRNSKILSDHWGFSRVRIR